MRKLVTRSPEITIDDLINGMLEELKRRRMGTEIIKAAEEILSKDKSRARILDAIDIDRDKIEKAIEIKNEIEALTNELIGLRYRVNQASKIVGIWLFEDNAETSRISNQLKDRFVTDLDQLHLFIDDLHKYIIQSADWGDLYKSPHIEPCLATIEAYRNNFNHIYDMKGKGLGAKKAFEDLGSINEKLLGHKVVNIEEFPILQIGILQEVDDMLMKLEKNIEAWLGKPNEQEQTS